MKLYFLAHYINEYRSSRGCPALSFSEIVNRLRPYEAHRHKWRFDMYGRCLEHRIIKLHSVHIEIIFHISEQTGIDNCRLFLTKIGGDKAIYSGYDIFDNGRPGSKALENTLKILCNIEENTFSKLSVSAFEDNAPQSLSWEWDFDVVYARPHLINSISLTTAEYYSQVIYPKLGDLVQRISALLLKKKTYQNIVIIEPACGQGNCGRYIYNSLHSSGVQQKCFIFGFDLYSAQVRDASTQSFTMQNYWRSTYEEGNVVDFISLVGGFFSGQKIQRSDSLVIGLFSGALNCQVLQNVQEAHAGLVGAFHYCDFVVAGGQTPLLFNSHIAKATGWEFFPLQKGHALNEGCALIKPSRENRAYFLRKAIYPNAKGWLACHLALSAAPVDDLSIILEFHTDLLPEIKEINLTHAYLDSAYLGEKNFISIIKGFRSLASLIFSPSEQENSVIQQFSKQNSHLQISYQKTSHTLLNRIETLRTPLMPHRFHAWQASLPYFFPRSPREEQTTNPLLFFEKVNYGPLSINSFPQVTGLPIRPITTPIKGTNYVKLIFEPQDQVAWYSALIYGASFCHKLQWPVTYSEYHVIDYINAHPPASPYLLSYEPCGASHWDELDDEAKRKTEFYADRMFCFASRRKSGTLADLMQYCCQYPVINWLKCCTPLLLQVCRGLKKLSDMGVVHNDLRAENILIEEGPDREISHWKACIADYGNAFILADRSIRPQNQSKWRAPEYGNPSLETTAMDIYGLAILIIECFSRISTTDYITEDIINIDRIDKKYLPHYFLRYMETREQELFTILQRAGLIKLLENMLAFQAAQRPPLHLIVEGLTEFLQQVDWII